MAGTAAPSLFAATGPVPTWSLGEGVRQMDLEFASLTATQQARPSSSGPSTMAEQPHIGQTALMEMDREFALLHGSGPGALDRAADDAVASSGQHRPEQPPSRHGRDDRWLQDAEAQAVDRQLREILGSDSAIADFYADEQQLSRPHIDRSSAAQQDAQDGRQPRQASANSHKQQRSNQPPAQDRPRSPSNGLPARLPTIEESVSAMDREGTTRDSARPAAAPPLQLGLPDVYSVTSAPASFPVDDAMSSTIDELALPDYPHIAQLPQQSTAQQCAVHLRDELLQVRRKAVDVEQRAVAQRREMDRVTGQLEQSTAQLGRYRVQLRRLEQALAEQKHAHADAAMPTSTSTKDGAHDAALTEAREECRRLQRQLEYAGYRIREVEEERDAAMQLAKTTDVQ
ncbi:hypothetical protein SYNPS1DRAFT_28691 [Syncephalis pseudoplumigaleata]|uniref:Uncharacterized protein n=1 Tax=Syncephalis pseudoplumigaleata TaxID=1712513 RepID=A0A4P9YZP3_9FUNG|nr:hypothetical protein SYNPS1DRAFT_28691 [Syncephalis pseudoplumigaleata]|eukprot:RKP25574.1 hypothetical protein SYNPS1DRAFT_28691 [Syncephalis pseudoplumigaleata]